MMERLIWGSLLLLLLSLSSVSAQVFEIDPLAGGVYAAVASPADKAFFNGLFWVGADHAAAIGSCLDPEALTELKSAVATVTEKPLRYCILAPGRSASLAEPPPSSDLALILDWRSWQTLQKAPSPLPFSFLFFRDDLTLELAGRTVTLLAAGKKDEDLMVFIPDEGLLYVAAAKSSDCGRKVSLTPLRKRSAPWQKAQALGAKIIVPACGSLVNSER
jgi:hypothetical protein